MYPVSHTENIEFYASNTEMVNAWIKQRDTTPADTADTAVPLGDFFLACIG